MIRLQYMILNNLKDEEIAFHFHSSYEITYYLSGAGYCEYQKQPISPSKFSGQETTHYIPPSASQKPKNKFYFRKGALIVFPPNTIHYKKHTEDSRFLSLVFDILDSALVPKNLHYSNVIGKNMFRFSEIEDEYCHKRSNYLKIVECLLTEICIELNRNETINNGVEDFITQTVHYIDDYFLSNIDFELYCRTNGYSLDYFRHKFKEFIGFSPKAYLLKKRTEYAASLLRFTELPIHEISEMCKFGDYMHFSTYFSSKYGMSPTKYRNSLKQNQPFLT